MFAKWVASSFLNFLIIALVGVAGYALYAKGQFTSPGPLVEDAKFEVERGARFGSVADRLEEANIITDASLFRVAARYSGLDRALKFGNYAVPAGASMEDVLALVTSGRSISEQVTFPEGFSSFQIVERLNAVETLDGELTELPPEGSLAPNTYAYLDGDSRAGIIEKMQAAQIEILDAAWEARQPDLPLANKEEALILASIIEKETGVSSEREMVSSVFINRLRRGMKLQTDPTVIYGITEGKSVLGRGLRRSELLKETAYNTYVIEGLPPTPIANPGKASIEAALNPAETSFLFFVADGTGGHTFSETLAEHNAAVRKWREIERQRQTEAEATEQNQ